MQSPHRRQRRRAWLLVATLFAAPSLTYAATPEPGGTTVTAGSVSQFGVTWTFSAPAEIGRFVNGDYYVVGPVTISQISPGFSSGRNGSMLNPVLDRYQGYDSREGESYRSNLVATTPLNLTPGDSLVSTVSRPGSQRIPHVMGDVVDKDSYGLLTDAAILSCVTEAQPGSFRPPYSGPRRFFRESDLRWDRLPRLEVAGSLPQVSFWERVFERPWIDHLTKVWLNRYIHPTNNMPDYGREMTLGVGMASLILASDITPTEKETLLYSLVQFGIDTWGLATQVDPGQGWESMGGHGNGRKWPMIFAGLMLDDPDILAAEALFSEDQQTYYGQGWNGATALYRYYHRDYPESVWLYETKHPRNWGSNEAQAEGYRKTSTSIGWAGQALVARAMGALDEWDHPAYFDYVDRWMNVPDTDDRATLESELGPKGLWIDWWDHYGQAGSGYNGWEGTTALRYPWDMWQRHRFDLDEPGGNSFVLDVRLQGTGSGSVTSSPSGIDCGGDCLGTYSEGTTVVLTPSPEAGSTFGGWGGDSDCLDGTVSMSSNTTCNAVFDEAPSQNFTLTVTRTGSGGGRVTSNPGGVDCGSDCTGSYAEGAAVVLTAVPNAGSTFNRWSGDSDCSDGRVSMAWNMTCQAVFDAVTTQNFSLTVTRAGSGGGTVTSNPSGINCNSDCSETYAEGTTVALTPTPNPGSVFDRWNGDSDCSNGSVDMTSNTTCEAVFNEAPTQSFTLTITRAGPGRGTVTTNMGGINCGSDCQESYPAGTVVVLEPRPDDGSVLRDIRGNSDCADGRVVIQKNISCKVRFFKGKRLRAKISGTGGRVRSSPANLDCRTDCSAVFNANAQVTLLPAPDPGWKLVEWKGHPDCRDGILDGNKSKNCHAVFARSESESKVVFEDGFEGGDAYWWDQ